MAQLDYYEALGVSREAGEGEIKSAYRKLAMKFHPDKNPGDKNAEEKFKEATAAYEVLKDSQKRRQYDQFGHAAFASGGAGAGGSGGFSGFGGFDIHDALRAFMRDFGGAGGGGVSGFADFFGGGREQSNRGEDLRVRLSLTLEELATGTKKMLRVKRLALCRTCSGSGSAPGSAPATCSQCGGAGRVRTVTRTFIGSIQQVSACPACSGAGSVISRPCESCGGKGRQSEATEVEVDIPAGASEGNFLTVEGRGNVGPQNGPAGDLQVLIEETEHERFIRQGDDIIYQHMISFSAAALGEKIEVPTLRGSVKIKIAPGTQSGKSIKLRGEGIPHLRSYGRGDQIVIITVWTPKKLSSEDKRLLEQLGRSDNFAPPKPSKSLFEKLRSSLGV